QELVYRQRPADLKKGLKSNGGYRPCFLRTLAKHGRSSGTRSLARNSIALSSSKIVLFGAIRLSRNDQALQRSDCQCLSAAKMSAQYLYWSDLSRPQLRLS